MSGQRAVTEQSRSTCADVSRVSVHRFISDFGLRMKSRITRVHTRLLDRYVSASELEISAHYVGISGYYGERSQLDACVFAYTCIGGACAHAYHGSLRIKDDSLIQRAKDRL